MLVHNVENEKAAMEVVLDPKSFHFMVWLKYVTGAEFRG